MFFLDDLISQTTVTGVVTDSLNNPVPFASVYLSKTTIGTLTDSKGAFSFIIPHEGAYEMITSCVGYKSNSHVIFANGKRQIINVKLRINLVLLNEITVRSKDKYRQRNYYRFIKLFIGETVNSQNCRILNPEDLHLYRDTQNNILKGFSTKPLRIENRALGYRIVYDLTDFNYNMNTGFLRFTGNPFFQPLTGTLRQNQKWDRNRLSAYYGSRMDLLRALFSDSLDPENFKLAEYRTDSATLQSSVVKLIGVNDLRISSDSKSIWTYYNKPLMISYTDDHPELNSGLLGFQKQVFLSSILFDDTLRIYQNGYYDNPYSVTWEGEMANERVADMLPYDFQPSENAKIKSDTIISSSPIENYLLAIQNSSNRDQVFVQTDRNMYKPYDTIYFQAYIRDRFTGIYESDCTTLYAILFNQKNEIADSSRFKIEGSTASGWMTIPPDAKPGKYQLTAFTGMMQNFDPSDAFQLDLYVREIGNRTSSNTDSIDQSKLKVATKRKTAKASAEKAMDTLPEDQYPEFRFLPEGGTLVSGLEQRIGFNATDINGEPVYVEGLLRNSNGAIVDTIKSGIYGPGLFVCTPRPGMYVELIKGAGNDTIWPLPDPFVKGMCLSVKPVNDRSFAVEIQSNSYNGDTITVTGIMNLNHIFTQKLVLDKKQRIVVETDQLPSGVALITLFNNDLLPVAERLFYVNADKHLRFNINTGNNTCRPGDETELSISVTDDQGNPAEGIFSISVADSLSGHNAEIFTPGIEYTYDYNPYFPANLPAKALVAGLENLTQEQRDLILMVYGWSKFKWNFRNAGTGIKQLPDYELLNMKILYALKNRRADRRLDLISLEGPSIKYLVTNNKGEISLPLDSLPEITRSVTIMPDTKNKKRVKGAMLNIPYNEKYFKSSKLLIPQPTIPADAYYTSSDNYNVSLGDSVIEIPEVTITGYPGSRKVYHDKYEEMYQYANVRSLDYEQLWSSFSLEIAIRKLLNPFMITDNFVILRFPKSFFGGPVTALMVLDGMPIYGSGGWPMVKTIPPSQITSLTILNGSQGYAQYGEAAQGGVIFINTRTDDPNLLKIRTHWILQKEKDHMLVPINIYRRNIEFYSPTKPDIDFDPVLQSRSTVFWQSEVYFNGNEPVKIKYTNLKRQGPVMITINGVSVNNLAGTGKTGYWVYQSDKK